MTNNEVNKIISKYMGEEYCKLPDNRSAIKFKTGNSQSVLKENYYTNSLDVLVPVIEKLDMYHDNYFGKANCEEGAYCFELVHSGGRHYRANGNTIQEAAAHATAKAILSLEWK